MEPLLEIEEKRVRALFWKYVLPSVAAGLAPALYYIVDSLFLAHGPGLGRHALGAFGVVLPAVTLLSALGTLAGIGTASRVSLCLGAGEHETARRVAGTSLVFTFIVSAMPIAAAYLWMSPLLRAMGATEETFGFARDFLLFYLPAALFLNMGTTLASILKATGFPALAMRVVALGIVLNLVSAPLFIFAFRWGMKGAGGATLVATVLSAALLVPRFLGRRSVLPLERSLLKLDGALIFRIVNIGFAPFLITAATSLTVFFTNRGLIAWGDATSLEGYVVASRFHYLFITVFAGISQGVQPIVGFCFGAGNYARLFRTLRYAFVVSFCFGLAALAAGVFAPESLAGIFAPGPELMREASRAMFMLTVTMPLAGCQILMSGFFQHTGIAVRSALLSFARIAVFLPLLFLLPLRYGVNGVWFALPVSETVVFLITAVVYYLRVRKMKRPAVKTSV